MEKKYFKGIEINTLQFNCNGTPFYADCIQLGDAFYEVVSGNNKGSLIHFTYLIQQTNSLRDTDNYKGTL